MMVPLVSVILLTFEFVYGESNLPLSSIIPSQTISHNIYINFVVL